jgi:riboflavin synthase alpha subunit
MGLVMGRDADRYFCFFSGYAKRGLKLLQREILAGVLHLKFSTGIDKFSVDEYIQINGVLCQVLEVVSQSIKVSTTRELATGTTLLSIEVGALVHYGRLIEKDFEHEEFWPLHPSACGTATYKSWEIAGGHEHLEELKFTCPAKFQHLIQNDEHLGLSGCSLTARKVELSADGLLYFSIFCGRSTRESTHFNRSLAVGTQVELTPPAVKVSFVQ